MRERTGYPPYGRLVGIVGMEGVNSIGPGAFWKSGLTGNFSWPQG